MSKTGWRLGPTDLGCIQENSDLPQGPAAAQVHAEVRLTDCGGEAGHEMPWTLVQRADEVIE
jgi:hypothetical protein